MQRRQPAQQQPPEQPRSGPGARSRRGRRSTGCRRARSRRRARSCGHADSGSAPSPSCRRRASGTMCSTWSSRSGRRDAADRQRSWSASRRSSIPSDQWQSHPHRRTAGRRWPTVSVRDAGDLRRQGEDDVEAPRPAAGLRAAPPSSPEPRRGACAAALRPRSRLALTLRAVPVLAEIVGECRWPHFAHVAKCLPSSSVRQVSIAYMTLRHVGDLQPFSGHPGTGATPGRI